MNLRKRNWLVELRRATGRTQSDVADALRLKRQAVAAWENGLNRPASDQMLLLSDLLGPEVLTKFGDEVRSEAASASTPEVA